MTLHTSSKPKLPTGFVRQLARDQAWPLFSVTLQLGGASVWAYVSELPPIQQRPDAWRHLLHEWRRLERACWHDGVRGWYCVCRFENVRMLRWLGALGCTPYGEIPGRGYLMKKPIETDPGETLVRYRNLVSRMKGGVAHA